MTTRGRILATVAAVLATWFAGLAAVAVLAEPTPTVIVFAPRQAAMASVVATGSDVLDIGRFFLLVRSERAGFVRRLYGAGAWLVLPMPEEGCLGPGPTLR
jgi:hypothetical protein